ncbi:hypothetical protein SDC9_192395 [bioreactor metagenome]|uniref:Uncharacterized protein n=1 Tax=bioreactor metagenome TaxID=1076179 RepID=A0A645I0Q0_9ZZZZ
MGCGFGRGRCVIIGDKVAKMAVLLLTDRGFKRDRLLRNAHNFTNLVHRHVDLFRNFFSGWFMAVFMQQLGGHFLDLVNRLHHVHRDTDGARLVGDGTGDSLTNPPGRIGREFKSLGVVKLFDSFNQTEITLLNQV